MYLDGQLPLGPDSLNLGGTVDTNPAAVSNTDIGAYLLPDGGPAIVSGSLAHEDGIVQTPVQQPIGQYSPLTAGQRGYALNSDCGDYASDGSLVTLRNRAGRGMGLLSGCQSGYQQVKLPSVSDYSPLLMVGGALALVIVGLSGKK